MDRLEDGRAHEGSGGHSEEGEGTDDAERPGPGLAFEQMRGGGGCDRDDRAATYGLDEAGGDQLVETLGQARQERSDREDRQCGQKEPARAQQVGQPAGEGHGHDVDQQVAVDDPGGLAQVRPVGDRRQNLRQGDGRDHQLEAGQEDADAENAQKQVRLSAAHGGSVRSDATPRAALRLGARATTRGGPIVPVLAPFLGPLDRPPATPGHSAYYSRVPLDRDRAAWRSR
jgi:hypothetical protein